MEVEWSDRAYEQPGGELQGVIEFCENTKAGFTPLVTPKSGGGDIEVDGRRISFRPVSVACHWIGMYIENMINEGRHPLSGQSFIRSFG